MPSKDYAQTFTAVPRPGTAVRAVLALIASCWWLMLIHRVAHWYSLPVVHRANSPAGAGIIYDVTAFNSTFAVSVAACVLALVIGVVPQTRHVAVWATVAVAVAGAGAVVSMAGSRWMTEAVLSAGGGALGGFMLGRIATDGGRWLDAGRGMVGDFRDNVIRVGVAVASLTLAGFASLIVIRPDMAIGMMGAVIPPIFYGGIAVYICWMCWRFAATPMRAGFIGLIVAAGAYAMSVTNLDVGVWDTQMIGSAGVFLGLALAVVGAPARLIDTTLVTAYGESSQEREKTLWRSGIPMLLAAVGVAVALLSTGRSLLVAPVAADMSQWGWTVVPRSLLKTGYGPAMVDMHYGAIGTLLFITAMVGAIHGFFLDREQPKAVTYAWVFVAIIAIGSPTTETYPVPLLPFVALVFLAVHFMRKTKLAIKANVFTGRSMKPVVLSVVVVGAAGLVISGLIKFVPAWASLLLGPGSLVIACVVMVIALIVVVRRIMRDTDGIERIRKEQAVPAETVPAPATDKHLESDGDQARQSSPNAIAQPLSWTRNVPVTGWWIIGGFVALVGLGLFVRDALAHPESGWQGWIAAVVTLLAGAAVFYAADRQGGKRIPMWVFAAVTGAFAAWLMGANSQWFLTRLAIDITAPLAGATVVPVLLTGGAGAALAAVFTRRRSGATALITALAGVVPYALVYYLSEINGSMMNPLLAVPLATLVAGVSAGAAIGCWWDRGPTVVISDEWFFDDDSFDDEAGDTDDTALPAGVDTADTETATSDGSAQPQPAGVAVSAGAGDTAGDDDDLDIVLLDDESAGRNPTADNQPGGEDK